MIKRVSKINGNVTHRRNSVSAGGQPSLMTHVNPNVPRTRITSAHECTHMATTGRDEVIGGGGFVTTTVSAPSKNNYTNNDNNNNTTVYSGRLGSRRTYGREVCLLHVARNFIC